MRILVTGGAGFIGSWFVRTLLDEGYAGLDPSEVTVLDKLTYAGNLANLDPVTTDPRLRIVIGDVADADLVDEVVAGQDLVVHFAAESHVDRSITAAADFVRTNVVGTQTLVQAARVHRVGRFVQVSTDEVYGSIADGAWTESAPLAPRSPYSASKASADLFIQAYHITHGVDVVTTRCSNNYGPYQFPEKVVPLFITNLLDGLPVPLYGDGGNVRDWLHVADHCRGIALVAAGGRAGEIYHIGGGTPLTNADLTRRLLRATGRDEAFVRKVPDRPGHDRRYALDTAKIVGELGYAPQIDLDTGLADTVAWYQHHEDWWRPLAPRA
ncbi:MAG: dTDP-glucose 4,6-dehydratase [Actinomycetes bacterium]